MGKFVATHCDACGRKYKRHEQIAKMGFTPAGATAEYQYTACMKCAPMMGLDPERDNKVVLAIAARAPQILQYMPNGGAA